MLHKDSPLIIVGSRLPCVGSNLPCTYYGPEMTYFPNRRSRQNQPKHEEIIKLLLSQSLSDLKKRFVLTFCTITPLFILNAKF